MIRKIISDAIKTFPGREGWEILKTTDHGSYYWYHKTFGKGKIIGPCKMWPGDSELLKEIVKLIIEWCPVTHPNPLEATSEKGE